MTKKNYELIATAIQGKVKQAQVLEDYHFQVEEYQTAARHQYAEKRIVELAADLATALKSDNPQFNTDKFMEACGIHGTTTHECHMSLWRA